MTAWQQGCMFGLTIGWIAGMCFVLFIVALVNANKK